MRPVMLLLSILLTLLPLAGIAWIASITLGRLPSLKFGTHSTRDVEDDVWVSLALTIVLRELH